MSWQPVVLWTDALVFTMVAAIILIVSRRHPQGQLHEAWQRLWQMPMAMATGLVLLVFVAIALLDSLHYRPLLPAQPGQSAQYGIEVVSVLDTLLQPLREHKEKTYSAPLATRLYVKETVTLGNGTVLRDYPRLQFGGAQLLHPQRDKRADIVQRVVRGSAIGLLLSALLAALIALMLVTRRRCSLNELLQQLLSEDNRLPWRTALLTVTVLSIIVAVMVELAAAYHVFGTDKIGQDVLYSSLKSIRTGLLIGTLTTLIMLPFAVLLGISAGYFGGWIDDLIQYVYTTLNAIPGVLLIAAAVLIMQVYIEMHPAMFDSAAARTDFRLLFLCIILGITSWTGLCRLLRGETLKLRELDYVQAARAFGVSDWRLMVRHILPNLYHLVLISVVMDFSGLVLAEAVLSYLGVGVDPAMQSWGNMINAARLEMARDPVVWWPLVAAFGLMFTLVLAANLFADSVRDAFDPHGRPR
ncbi:peptide ABC transporter permease [Sulfuriferula sp. AH1]|uniref:ABC transporter permease n=1 Tax=Sulfuriferula sp. AH1 TaxID=1985873 RepID=UPI000B3B5ECC|nr:ABC transporter permease [Sulfuriferula sp. AH1]ARU31643.1 peptide ABC transporter permease [Sulfuriferula sp. AH1]